MVAPRDASKLNAENFIEEDPYAATARGRGTAG